MKKYLFLLAIATVILTACDKNSTSELDLDKKLSFTTLTVEEQKSTIEENGTSMLEAMQGINETQAFKTADYLLNFGYNQPMAVPMLKLKNLINQNSKDASKSFIKALKVLAVDEESIWGKWQYNFSTQTMEKLEDLNNEITMYFPADSLSTTNNGYIHFIYSEVLFNIDGYDEYYPESMDFEMKVNNAIIMSASFDAKYYDDAFPKSATESLNLDVYSWKTTFSNDLSKSNETLEIKKGDVILIKSLSEAEGTLTREALSNYNPGESESPIQKVAGYFQVMDLAIKGGSDDLVKLTNETSALDSQTLSDREYYDALTEVLNSNTVMYAMFVSSNTKIADIEFYTLESTQTYETWVYNPVTYEWQIQTVTESWYEVAPRLVLGDGSKMTIDEYMDSSFDDMFTEYENYFNQTQNY